MDIDALQLLQEDLRDEDQEERIAGVSRLPIVAMALGAARTREELLPFLLEFSDSDNDEVLTAVARQLGDFTELVGGSAFVPTLLPLLEKLCGEEECVVRNTVSSGFFLVFCVWIECVCCMEYVCVVFKICTRFLSYYCYVIVNVTVTVILTVTFTVNVTVSVAVAVTVTVTITVAITFTCYCYCNYYCNYYSFSYCCYYC
jgi:hypothetical protein